MADPNGGQPGERRLSFRKVSSRIQQKDPSQREQNPFSSGDARNKEDLLNKAHAQDKWNKELNSKNDDTYEKALSKLIKSRLEFKKIIKDESEYLIKLTEELDKTNRALKKADNAVDRDRLIKEKNKLLLENMQRFQDFTGNFVEALAQPGGASPEVWEAFEKQYATFNQSLGRDESKAKESLEELKKKVKEAQDSRKTAAEKTDAFIDIFGKLSTDIDEARQHLDAVTEELQKVDKALLDKVKEYERTGQVFKATLAKMRANNSLGPGVDALAKSKTFDVLSGGRSKNLSKYVGEDGKINNAEIYKTLLSGMGDAAKMGFEAYRNSRQYGTMGMGFGDIYSTYQAHKREVAKIALTTGVSEEQANATYGGVAANLRVGIADPKVRYQQMVDLTKQTIKLATSTGLSEDKVIQLATAYRKNFSGGPLKAMQTTTTEIAKTLIEVNANVADDFKLTSEDVADIWERLAGDVKNSGTSMSKLMDLTRGVAMATAQANIPYLKRVELMKQVEAFKTGKWGQEGGENAAAQIVAMGGLPSAAGTVAAGFGASGYAGANSRDIISTLAGKSKGTTHEKFFTELAALEATNKDYNYIYAALTGGMDPIRATTLVKGDFMGLARDIFRLDGAKEVLGISIDDWDDKFKNIVRGLPEEVQASMGISGVQMAAREMDSKGRVAYAKARASGKTPEEVKAMVEQASETNAKLAAAADPMAAFGKAVNVFAGSVNTFAALTAAKGLFDAANLASGGGGLLSLLGRAGLGTAEAGAGAGLFEGLGLGMGAEAGLGAMGAETGLGAMGAGLGVAALPLAAVAAAGLGVYQGFAEKAPEAQYNVGGEDTFIDHSGTRWADKNAEEWAPTLLKAENAYSDSSGMSAVGKGIGVGLRYTGWATQSVWSSLKDAGANIKDWLGFGEDEKTPAQATGVKPQGTTVNVNAQGGTAYYDAARGGTVAPLEIFTPSEVSYQSTREGGKKSN